MVEGFFKSTPADPAEVQRQEHYIAIRDAIVRLKWEKRDESQKAVGRIEVQERTGLTYSQIVEALDGESLESFANSGKWVVGPDKEKLILSGNSAGVDITLDAVLLAGRNIAIDEGLSRVTLEAVAAYFGPFTLAAVSQIGATDRILQGMIASNEAQTMRTDGASAVLVGQAIAERHPAVSLVSLDDRRYVCRIMADTYTPRSE